jgi:hypothetical protein
MRKQHGRHDDHGQCIAEKHDLEDMQLRGCKTDGNAHDGEHQKGKKHHQRGLKRRWQRCKSADQGYMPE